MKKVTSVYSRGFALVAAIMLVGIVGMVLAVMATLVASEGRRTSSVRQETQLRQLLLAGAVSAPERVSRWDGAGGEERWSVALPVAMTADGAEVSSRMTSVAGGVRQVEVEAKLGRHRMVQVLRFAPAAGGWQLQSAALNRE